MLAILGVSSPKYLTIQCIRCVCLLLIRLLFFVGAFSGIFGFVSVLKSQKDLCTCEIFVLSFLLLDTSERSSCPTYPTLVPYSLLEYLLVQFLEFLCVFCGFVSVLFPTKVLSVISNLM